MVEVVDICVSRDASIRSVLATLDRTALGVVLLVDGDQRFIRTVTDGDLRRLLLEDVSLDDTLARLPQKSSRTLAPGYTRREALELMRQHVINHVPVIDAEGRVIELVERKAIDEQILLSTPHMGDAELRYVNEAFETNWIAPLGPNVDAFEREVADLVGARHAVALSSGTAAIHLSLILLGVGPGDTVFCSTLTFAASVNPIRYQGAEPVLIDSEPESWNMSPAALERALEWARRENRLPKAVVIVCLYGQSADMDPLMEICDRYGVPIVEDAAESLGAKYKGRASGTFGEMGIYSFNGNKIITTSGGGMLITEDKSVADRARFLATQARDPAPHYQHSTVGYNYRMSNILAGVGRGQLTVLSQRVAARRAVFNTYKTSLAGASWLEWMPEPDWSYSTHWLSGCVVAADFKMTATDVIAKLAAEFIEARPLWKPMHLQPVFADHPSFDHSNTSVSADLFSRGICLPSGSNLPEADIERVVATLRALG